MSSTARFVASQSVLTLDARHPYTARALVDAQHMHRNVMSGFYGWVEDGAADARAQMGVLSTWTVDLESGLLVLVVQSRVPADWSRVPADALKEKPRTLNVDRVLKAGDSLTFRTVVNPTRAASPGKDATEKKIRGKRIAHTTAHHAAPGSLSASLLPENPPPIPRG